MLALPTCGTVPRAGQGVLDREPILVFYNGEQKAEIDESGSGWYWKVGGYTQSNPEKGDTADVVGEVVVYSLKIDHAEA